VGVKDHKGGIDDRHNRSTTELAILGRMALVRGVAGDGGGDEMTKEQEDALCRAIARFPFEHVREHMLECDWTWLGDEVPSVDAMVLCVRDLAASSRDDYGCSSGGFCVSFLEGYVTVEFGKVTLDESSCSLWKHSERIR
jgi:hypothetical protein